MKDLNRDFSTRKKNILDCHKILNGSLQKALAHTQCTNADKEEVLEEDMEIESPEKRHASPVKEERKSATRNQGATPSVNESRHQSAMPSPFKVPKASGKASVAASSTLRKLTVFGDAPHGHATNGATDQFMYPARCHQNSEEIGNNSADLIEFKGRGRGKLSFW